MGREKTIFVLRLCRRTAEGGCLPMTLIAADVVLGRDEHQARAGWNRFGACGLAEGAQDSEDCDVGGQDSEADGGDNGEAEENGHQKRDHGLKVLFRKSARSSLA